MTVYADLRWRMPMATGYFLVGPGHRNFIFDAAFSAPQSTFLRTLLALMQSTPDYIEKSNIIRQAFINRQNMQAPYKVIKSLKQYKEYCNILEEVVMSKKKTPAHQDTIDLLTLLIEKWDEAHNTFTDADPVELLSYLMKETK